MAALNLRASAHSSIVRLGREIQDENFDPDYVECEVLLGRVNQHFDRFVQHHFDLVGKAKQEEVTAHDELFATTEELYTTICVALQRRLKPPATQVKPTITNHQADMRLDPLTIPRFDGKSTSWLAFKDLFETLVHNRSDLNPAFKLGKLRQCVDQDRVPMIGGLYTGGYDEVWSELKRRYDNPRLLSETHVQSLLNLPDNPAETPLALRNIVDCVRNSFRALAVMQIPVEHWDAIAVPVLLPKLPTTTRNEWGMSLKTSDIPKLEDLLQFIERRSDNISSTPTPANMQPALKRGSGRTVKAHVGTANATQSPDAACPQCSANHRLMKCQRFRNLDVQQRWETVKQGIQVVSVRLVCVRSASRNTTHFSVVVEIQHMEQAKKLRTLYHQYPAPLRHPPQPMLWPKVQPRHECIHVSNDIQMRSSHSLSKVTGLSYLQRPEFYWQIAMDSDMSVVHYATSDLRTPGEIRVEGIGANTTIYTKGTTTVQMTSLIDNTFSVQFEVYILPTITTTTPVSEVDTFAWNHISGLKLADPNFGTPDKIDLLIGADIWPVLIAEGISEGSLDEPCALRTRLGWVVFGPATINTRRESKRALCISKCTNTQRLDELLQRFWQVDEIGPATDLSVDPCERIFIDTVRRISNGRYSVQIPFRPDAPALGQSYQIARRQFFNLERKLAGDVELRNNYITFMREYIALGHMNAVDYDSIGPTECYYIPHHAVTGKFRVVFNASCKTTNGLSLNDTQFAGPQLQDNLIDILHRFRRFQIAITADIKKMFRQVEVNPLHRKWQRILWRESPLDPLRIFELATVTYGMTSGPYNAIRSLRQCAIDNFGIVDNDCRAVTARNSILSAFYVDDYLESFDSSEEAVHCAQDVDKVLRQGHFILSKWNSNCARTLGAITVPEKSSEDIEFSDSKATVLGLHWDPLTDELFFKVRISEIHTPPTKRNILSDVAKLYDPVGILAPVVVLAKIFIQLLWKADLNWDTPLPTDLRDQWLEFRNGLHELAQIRVPRWLYMSSSAPVILHGFCDASSRAYAAVIYANSMSPSGDSKMALVTAKTKVAPVKGITIPRLELCAAHLLVTTLNHVRNALRLEHSPYILWSDSTIVLYWIRKQPASLKQFVANRVAFIQANTDVTCWHHIRSEFNPADCASRGIMPSALQCHPLWWTGPPYRQLRYDDEAVVPELTDDQYQSHTAECHPLRALVAINPDHQLLTTAAFGRRIPLLDKFSTLGRVLNTTVRLRRFLNLYRGHRSKPVTAEEREWALHLTIKQVQGKEYKNEINALKSNFRLDSRSEILTLNPYMDDECIIRVGGRLKKADIPDEQRHPIIIPKGTFANLLIADAHHRCLHGGIQQMLQYLRQRFWVIHARSQVKAYVWRCTVCRRHQRILQKQQMASLPRERVLVAPPFSNSGLDYCGPFHVRTGGKRSNATTKTYAAIFVCMASRAVHIELAEDLSTRSFIDVYDRFVSRRGICAKLFSDNGTQFVGADRQMRDDLKAWMSTYALQHVAQAGTQWNFIAPAAPHHGGIWEAAVRSTKKHLLRIMGRQSLRYNDLNTLLARIEACLNSRPLMALHDDPQGILALTPGDFLIGRPLNSRPEPPLPDIPENRLLHWQRLQKMYEHFWVRWQNEYLTTLQARSKWMRPEPNLQLDDVVLIRNENLPPAYWRIGRIINVHPGSDGLVRVVTIAYNGDQLTSEGTYVKRQCQRPVQKVVRLTGINEEILNREGSAGQDV